MRLDLRTTCHLLFALSICGVSWACDKAQVAGGDEQTEPAPTLFVTNVEVRGLSALDDEAHAAFKDEVRDQVEKHLDGGAIAFTPDPDGKGARVTLTFELLDQTENRALHIEWLGEGQDHYGPFTMRADAWATIGVQNDAEARSRAADLATAELARQLEGMASVMVASNEDLTGLLQSADNAVLVAAAREIQRRKLEERLPEVRDLLVHPSKDVVLVALAVLGQMGDRDSVGPIRDLVTSPDDEKVEQALYALGSIGGESALQALSAVAESHPDPRVRAIATESFMRARDKK